MNSYSIQRPWFTASATRSPSPPTTASNGSGSDGAGCPILTLPSELLLQILQVAADDDKVAPYTLALISRTFYELATTTPSLWARISIPPHPLSHSNRKQLSRLVLHLKYAKDVPLSVRLPSMTTAEAITPTLLGLLNVPTTRWRELRVKINSREELNNFPSICRTPNTMPMLTSLLSQNIAQPAASFRWPGSASLDLSELWPSLQSLSVSVVESPTGFYPSSLLLLAPPALRVLYLSIAPPLSPDSFLEVLHMRCPNLRELTLFTSSSLHLFLFRGVGDPPDLGFAFLDLVSFTTHCAFPLSLLARVFIPAMPNLKSIVFSLPPKSMPVTPLFLRMYEYEEYGNPHWDTLSYSQRPAGSPGVSEFALASNLTSLHLSVLSGSFSHSSSLPDFLLSMTYLQRFSLAAHTLSNTLNTPEYNSRDQRMLPTRGCQSIYAVLSKEGERLKHLFQVQLARVEISSWELLGLAKALGRKWADGTVTSSDCGKVRPQPEITLVDCSGYGADTLRLVSDLVKVWHIGDP